jgi:putative ABC transport system permease protein
VWRVVLRSHQLHRMRLVLICLAIAVGVAFLAGTFILTDTDTASIAATSEQAYANVSVAVQGHLSSSLLPGLARYDPVPASALSAVRRVRGVARAQGEVDGYAQLVARDGSLIGGDSSAARGISVGPVPGLRPFVLDAGKLPATPGQVVVDAHTFAAQGWHLGQRVRVVTNQPARRFTVVGTITSRRSSDVLGTTLVGFAVPEAQRLLSTSGTYSVILASASPGTTPAELISRVAAAVGPGYAVETGQAFRHLITAISSNGAPKFSTVLDVVLGIALFVGALVIFNIISIMVAQRRRELALLRGLGASRAQVFRSVLAEAAAMGFVASVVGIGLGIAAAAILLRVDATSPGAQTSAAGLDVSLGTVLASLAMGTGVTVLAAVLPALSAGKVPPVSALRRDALDEAAESSSRWRVTGLVLAPVGLALMLVGLYVDQGDRVELWLVGAGLALTLVGLGRLSPLLVPPVIRVLGWPLGHLVGLPGHLGRQNTMRDARRTVVTATALVVGVALVSLLSIMVSSAKASDNLQVSQALSAQFEVLHTGAGALSSGPADSEAISPAVLTRLRAQPGLVVSPFDFVTFTLKGRSNWGVAVDPATISHLISFGKVEGSIAALRHGGIAVASQLAQSSHVHLGEDVDVALVDQIQSGTSSRMRVVAVYPQGDFALAGFLFSTATASRIDPSLALSAVLVNARPGVSPGQAEQDVTRAVAGFSDISVQDPAQVQAETDQGIASQVNLVSVLLILAIVVAVLGIVNSLALSVVERTRELALLRAVGMSKAQMRAMVRSEAVLIGAVGALLGVLLGLFGGWAFQRALSSSQGIIELAVPWTRLAVFVVAGAAIGIVAGTVPARRAARVDMLAAIASE